jgi:hypothetical protein
MNRVIRKEHLRVGYILCQRIEGKWALEFNFESKRFCVLASQILIFSRVDLTKTALRCMEINRETENKAIGKNAVVSKKSISYFLTQNEI